jgi:methylmalonyl-CoA epimerase
MAVKGIHHLGVAVADLDQATDTYVRLFGAVVEGREALDDDGVDAVSLKVGESRIELLGARDADSPVGRFLTKRGPGMHHVAFEVGDVADELDRLASSGAQLIDERPRPGAFGMTVGFVHPDATGGVLTELVSRG